MYVIIVMIDVTCLLDSVVSLENWSTLWTFYPNGIKSIIEGQIWNGSTNDAQKYKRYPQFKNGKTNDYNIVK